MLCSPKSYARLKSLQIRAVGEKCSKSRISGKNKNPETPYHMVFPDRVEFIYKSTNILVLFAQHLPGLAVLYNDVEPLVQTALTNAVHIIAYGRGG